MNNKLIADIERNKKRNYLLGNIVPELEILVKNGGAYTKEESMEALNKIRDKLVLLQSELKNSNVIARKLRRELYECCTHEILIKRSNYYECAICGECFRLENIDFNTFLIDSLEERSNLYYIISCIVSEIAMNDGNIFDVFENRLYEKYREYYKEDDLLVYRRSR